MSLNSSKEDSDHLSKLQEQNRKEHEDAAEEVEDSGKRKRQSDQRKYTKETEKKKKNRLKKLIHSRVLPLRGFSSAESTSCDSITGKSMSIAIFDLTLNENIVCLTI